MCICMFFMSRSHLLFDLCATFLTFSCFLLSFTLPGIGLHVAMDFARRGARVILACRNESLGMAALKEITKATGNTDVHLRLVDLSCMDSVSKFATRILEEEKALHILVNNAGVSGDTCPF